MRQEKPFKGVIRDWWLEQVASGTSIVNGLCMWHADEVPLASALASPNDGIVRGQPIHTSRVLTILDYGTFKMLETKNSIYILISPRPE